MHWLKNFCNILTYLSFMRHLPEDDQISSRNNVKGIRCVFYTFIHLHALVCFNTISKEHMLYTSFSISIHLHAFVGFDTISKEHMLYTPFSISIILTNAHKIYKVSINQETQQSDAKNFILTSIYSW